MSPPRDMVTEKPIEVAIVGGGCAGMAAAFELTRPEHDGRYRVTVYQLGWRLGGKGASGRGPSDRIEEHGLHLWMGFYDNAFRLMRECYAEARRDPKTCRIADWSEAFTRDHFLAVADMSPKGAWLHWKINLPPRPGLPGDPAPRRWTVAEYVASAVVLLGTLLRESRERTGKTAARAAAEPQPYPTDPSAVMEGITRLMRFGQFATLEALTEALRLLEVSFSAFPRYPENVIRSFFEMLADAVRGQRDALVEQDDYLRRVWEVIDLVLAGIRGAFRFRLMVDPRGFDAIDDYDCREWLKLNGASDDALKSGFIRALYDLAFAYEDGDVGRPRIAAGQALRGTMRAFLTYRGAFFWKMRGGMGDVVFAPFWEVLQKRGVRFEFFHRLENVRVADGAPGERPHVSALEFDVQATVRNNAEYQPLVDVKGVPSWPSDPDWGQLADGERMKSESWSFESHWDRRRVVQKTLLVGKDFDAVVLAVGVGAIPHVCKELIARDPRWQAMVEKVKSVPTQAFQIWMSEDMKQLGWNDGPINFAGFVEPFDTWADMTHLVPEESHPPGVKSIAYFCSVLPDAAAAADVTSPDYPEKRREEVKANAIQFLDKHVRHLWPNACEGNAFRWDVLAGPPGSPADESRFDAQYWRANVNPTDRYSLSLPGTLRYRISPLDHSFDNLTVAGDWTNCGFTEGCVEAAVMSGRLAAHAISKSPPLDEIVGFDYP